VDDGFLGLRREDVCAAHSNAILGSRALLEDMSLRSQRLILVYKNALVLRYACVWLRGARNGGHKLFGKHGRYRECDVMSYELSWKFFGGASSRWSVHAALTAL
jgi:hypothetical protein